MAYKHADKTITNITPFSFHSRFYIIHLLKLTEEQYRQLANIYFNHN
jgi:hypothetical protein